MTKYLVVDIGWFGDKDVSSISIIHKHDEGCSTVRKYREYGKTHVDVLSNIVCDTFVDYECDFIVIDIMGASICVYDKLCKMGLKDYMIEFKNTTQSNSDAICRMCNDIQHNKLILDYAAKSLYDIYKSFGSDNFVYFTNNGFLKLDKSLDFNIRNKIHNILGYYHVINKQTLN